MSSDEYDRLKDIEGKYKSMNNSGDGIAGGVQVGAGKLETIVENAVQVGAGRLTTVVENAVTSAIHETMGARGKTRKKRGQSSHANPWYEPPIEESKNYTVVDEAVANKKRHGRIVMNDVQRPPGTVVVRTASTAEFKPKERPKKIIHFKKQRGPEKSEGKAEGRFRWYYLGQ